MTTLTMELFPERKINYPALLTAFVFQSMLVVALIHFASINRVQVIVAARSLVYTPLAEITESVVPQTRIRAYAPPIVRRLVISKSSPLVRIPAPVVVEPPKVEVQAKAPALPIMSVPLPKPTVQVGAFLHATEKPSLPKATPAAQVQTGGFGDPNGVKGEGGGKSKVTVATLGVFGVPDGPGYGNGAGDGHGRTGTVQSSGFGDESAASGGVVKAQPLPERNAGKSVEIVSKPTPSYTEEARQLRLEGEVLLRVQFLTSGEVRILKVLQGLGHGLDEQAMHAAERIKFKPAEHDGQQIDSEATVHIIFELAS
jgi:TonB family protein